MFVALSGVHYRKVTGQADRKRWQERRLREDAAAVQAFQSGLPSTDSVTVAAADRRADALFAGPVHVEALLAHYMQRPERAKRLCVHIRTQRVLHREARRLVGGCVGGRPWKKEEVVIAWGNASTGYNSIIKRHGRGPNKVGCRQFDGGAHLPCLAAELPMRAAGLHQAAARAVRAACAHHR